MNYFLSVTVDVNIGIKYRDFIVKRLNFMPMSEAMVSPLERSFGKRLALPTTIMTAIVSPSALPLPSRKAIKMLRREAGRISLRIM